jgi:protein-serine/threonine kinase
MVFLTWTFGGSPWSQARESDERYARFKRGWDAFFEKYPDGTITSETGFPSLGPLFTADQLGTAAVKRIMIQMLHPMPERRISIQDVLNSSWVKGIECCTPEQMDDDSASVGVEHKCTPKKGTKQILRKHSHIPPKEHKTPIFFQHRFDMGDGY